MNEEFNPAVLEAVLVAYGSGVLMTVSSLVHERFEGGLLTKAECDVVAEWLVAKAERHLATGEVEEL